MRICMVCETPYGILNSVNYAVHSKKEGYIWDMYVGDGFQNAKEIAGRLRECGWFEHVWVYRRRTDEQSLRERMDRKYYRKRYLKDVIQEPNYVFLPYDEIYLASATRFPMCMILACRDAKVFYIDDGFRSYMNDIYVEPLSKLEYLMCRLAGKRPHRAVPKTVYLNNVSMCAETAAYEIRQLPSVPQKSTAFYKDICRIFGYNLQEKREELRIVYLAQALEADLKVPGVSEVEHSVEQALGELDEDIVYRPHPRNPVKEKKGLRIDRKGEMWELVCMDGVTEDTILISVYSTAMFTPKLLCGKEPWLIFTYPLYRKCLEGKWGKLTEDIETMVRRIREAYRRPEKVICVENIAELGKYIREIPDR